MTTRLRNVPRGLVLENDDTQSRVNSGFTPRAGQEQSNERTTKQSEQLDHRATASPDSHRFRELYGVSDRDRSKHRMGLRALHLDSNELGLPQRLFGPSAGCACGKWLNLQGRTRNRKNGTSAAILGKRCLLANVLSLSALPASGGCRITSMKRHAAKLSRCETV
jgi:hypothetical protein